MAGNIDADKMQQQWGGYFDEEIEMSQVNQECVNGLWQERNLYS